MRLLRALINYHKAKRARRLILQAHALLDEAREIHAELEGPRVTIAGRTYPALFRPANRATPPARADRA